MGTTKPALPSPFNYFTRIDINHHFDSTINRHPPITLDDSNTIQSLQINLPLSIPLFNFSPTSAEKIQTAIQNLSAKSMGQDAISQHMLNLVSPTVTPILTSICNCSFATSTFSTLWKQILINLLLKILTPLTISDTRPIAILPEQSKIFEREAFNQLLEFLVVNQLLDPRQARYRRGHSIETALTAVTEDIRHVIEETKIMVLILFDFSKAFHSISHQRLLQKLRTYNLFNPTITGSYSYIYERYQAVIDEDGIITSWAKSSSGVPQGSILGPLLFVLFINYLLTILRGVSYMLNADDAQVYGHFTLSEINEGIEIMQQNAQDVFDWATENGMELNVRKTKTMIFGSARNLAMLPNGLPQIEINGSAIPYV